MILEIHLFTCLRLVSLLLGRVYWSFVCCWRRFIWSSFVFSSGASVWALSCGFSWFKVVFDLFQAFFFVTVRPLSKNLYRRINRVLAELLWLELVWIIDWWAGVKVFSLCCLLTVLNLTAVSDVILVVGKQMQTS